MLVVRPGFMLSGGSVRPHFSPHTDSRWLRPPRSPGPIRLDPPGAESQDGPRLPRRGSFPSPARGARLLVLVGRRSGAGTRAGPRVEGAGLGTAALVPAAVRALRARGRADGFLLVGPLLVRAHAEELAEAGHGQHPPQARADVHHGEAAVPLRG